MSLKVGCMSISNQTEPGYLGNHHLTPTLTSLNNPMQHVDASALKNSYLD